MGIENQDQINFRSLEQLRNGLRGDDAAVVETGSSVEREKMLDILKDPDHHSREELIRSMFANYSGEAYGDYQWQKETGGWTTPKEPTVYGKFRERYPEFAKLSLDAGFITHLSEFMEMLEKGEIMSTGFEGARNELKEKLGYKIIYRGMMLTDEELQSVKNNGLMSPVSRHIQKSEQPKLEFEAKVISTNINYSIEAHFHGENYTTPYLSVSGHEDVAIAVGRHFGKREPGSKFYLFKLKVPVIDLISYQEHGVKTPYKLKEMIDRNPDYSLAVSVNGKDGKYKWDEDVESYVFWKIDPENILDVTQPEIKESSWNNRKTL
jgi:hypothetical protein